MVVKENSFTFVKEIKKNINMKTNKPNNVRYYIMNITTCRPLRYNEKYGDIVYYDTYEEAEADLNPNEKVMKAYF